jgi:uncharacterized protein
MAMTTNPSYRAAAVGVAVAALIVGAFSLGASRASGSASRPAAKQARLTASSSAPGRITVTGTGTVNGTPNQLVASMTVQVNAASVSYALIQADRAERRVTSALRERGVAASDIQTSDLYVQPNYQGNSQVPASYGVSESLTITLNDMSRAGAQIDAAVNAGGNAVTVDDVAVNLTDTSGLLAAARAKAIADARTQASQYATAMGEPLGSVISVTPVEQASPEFGNLDEPAASSAGKAASVPISPGSQQLTVTITVVYAA